MHRQITDINEGKDGVLPWNGPWQLSRGCFSALETFSREDPHGQSMGLYYKEAADFIIFKLHHVTAYLFLFTYVYTPGGRIVGKAGCEDLCFSASSWTNDTGPVFNPHDPARAAGGSSSGSAVVVSTSFSHFCP